MIAVDSPVLVELLSNGPQADAVEAILRQSLVGGRVVVCGATLAEVCASLRGGGASGAISARPEITTTDVASVAI